MKRKVFEKKVVMA